ncbi:MAG: restriction endonuclease subunit S [Spirochaetaceae bacterium]|nr:restriction endonuclease subunit S [Spirochaetaceae bacterium]
MKNEIEHTSTMLGSQNMKSSQRMVSVVEPYELPEGWKWVQQNEVCKLTDGEKRTGTEFPYLEVKYLRGKKEKDFVSTGKFIKAGTKVILVDGENSGEVFTVPEDGFMGSTFKALEISNVNENYLQYFIHTKKDLYRNNKKGSAIPHLDKKLFFTMPFPLPPTLAEQQRIVNRIESMFAKLDEAKEKAQNVVDGFETRKVAILHKAFTGELTAKWRKENGVSDDSWEEKKIGECGKWERGRSKHRPRNAPELFGGKYPFIQTGDIANADIYIYEHKQTLSEFGFQQSRLFPKDTLCITIAANIGKVAILTYDCCFPDSVVGFTPFENVDSKFMYYKINDMQKDLEAMAPATAQKNLNLKLLTSVSVQIPTFPEQVEIVRILDIIIEKETRAKEAAQNVLDKIALLKKSILARAFRGKI